MNTSLRDLTARIDALRPPDFDPAALIRQAEVRSRRRRTATWVAAGAAVALVAAGAAVVDRGEDHSAPPARQDKTDVAPAAPVRQIAYGGGYWPTTTIHYGHRTIDIARELSVRPAQTSVVHMDVTDDGVAFTIATSSGAGRGVWFTDGATTRRIGRIEGYLGIRNNTAVVSGTAGSEVAWIEEPEQETSTIVLYDTHAHREARRAPVPGCGTSRSGGCFLDALVGDNHVYFHRRGVLMRLDASTGDLERVNSDLLAVDLASRPRGIILGDSPAAGMVTNGYGTGFTVRGDSLVPMREVLVPAGRPRSEQDPATIPTKAFDTSTGKQLAFRLPPGYDAAAEYTAFEWLDDDRLAVMNGANSWGGTNADILTCRITTGRCEVAVPADRGEVRMLPHLPLPG